MGGCQLSSSIATAWVYGLLSNTSLFNYEYGASSKAVQADFNCNPLGNAYHDIVRAVLEQILNYCLLPALLLTMVIVQHLITVYVQLFDVDKSPKVAHN